MSPTDLLSQLLAFVSDGKKQKFEQVLEERTRYLTVVLENIYQPHNASAVLRSCDGFGVQDVHIIEQNNSFKTSSGVTIGSDKWLTLSHYSLKTSSDPTQQCLSKLKEQGYMIVATSPHHQSDTIETLPLDQKIALVFGGEKPGLTSQAFQHADRTLKIPMYGFSESFNISVCAALCLYGLTQRIRTTLPRKKWQINDQEKQELIKKWAISCIPQGELVYQKILKDHNNRSN